MSFRVKSFQMFSEANVRVLFIGNFEENVGHPIGRYKTKFKKGGSCNKYQRIWNESEVTEYGIEELKKQFNLSPEMISTIFG